MSINIKKFDQVFIDRILQQIHLNQKYVRNSRFYLVSFIVCLVLIDASLMIPIKFPEHHILISLLKLALIVLLVFLVYLLTTAESNKRYIQFELIADIINYHSARNILLPDSLKNPIFALLGLSEGSNIQMVKDRLSAAQRDKVLINSIYNVYTNVLLRHELFSKPSSNKV